MTVTETMITQVSPFVVDTDFSAIDYAQYKTWAALELDQLDPGLDAVVYDYCHALLICHFYESSGGSGAQYKSERIGDYSYTRADAGDAASTAYYNRFKQIIAQWNTEQPTAGVEREDADKTYPKKKFKLDQSAKAVFE